MSDKPVYTEEVHAKRVMDVLLHSDMPEGYVPPSFSEKVRAYHERQ